MEKPPGVHVLISYIWKYNRLLPIGQNGNTISGVFQMRVQQPVEEEESDLALFKPLPDLKDLILCSYRARWIAILDQLRVF
jgi:hypothetical protein